MGRNIDVAFSAAPDDAIAETEAIGLFERHGKNAAVAKADHLRANRPAATGADLAEVAHGGRGTARLDDQANQLDDLAFRAHRFDPVQGGGVTAQVNFGCGGHIVFTNWPGGPPGLG